MRALTAFGGGWVGTAKLFGWLRLFPPEQQTQRDHGNFNLVGERGLAKSDVTRFSPVGSTLTICATVAIQYRVHIVIVRNKQ